MKTQGIPHCNINSNHPCSSTFWTTEPLWSCKSLTRPCFAENVHECVFSPQMAGCKFHILIWWNQRHPTHTFPPYRAYLLLQVFVAASVEKQMYGRSSLSHFLFMSFNSPPHKRAGLLPTAHRISLLYYHQCHWQNNGCLICDHKQVVNNIDIRKVSSV